MNSKIKVECDDGLWWWIHKHCSLASNRAQHGGPVGLKWEPAFEGAQAHIEKHRKAGR